MDLKVPFFLIAGVIAVGVAILIGAVAVFLNLQKPKPKPPDGPVDVDNMPE